MKNANDDAQPVEGNEDVEYEAPAITPLGGVQALTLITGV